MHRLLFVALCVTFLLASRSLAAAPPEAKCEAAKNRASGAYARCLQDAAAKLVLTGDAAKHQVAVARCAATLAGQFAKAEAAAARKGAACPTTGDVAELDAWIAAHAGTVGAAVAADGALPTCGDGVVNAVGEHCDTADLGGATCAELDGHPDGTLGCTAACRFDTSTCVSPCEADGGVDAAGTCWFLAAGATTSCDAVCAAQSRTCNEAATRDHAGSGGTLASCQDLVDALAPASAPHGASDADGSGCGSPELGIGCVWSPGMSVPISIPPAATRTTAPVTTCAATGNGGGCLSLNHRVCACD
jgi:hypothetical protein